MYTTVLEPRISLQSLWSTYSHTACVERTSCSGMSWSSWCPQYSWSNFWFFYRCSIFTNGDQGFCLASPKPALTPVQNLKLSSEISFEIHKVFVILQPIRFEKCCHLSIIIYERKLEGAWYLSVENNLILNVGLLLIKIQLHHLQVVQGWSLFFELANQKLETHFERF